MTDFVGSALSDISVTAASTSVTLPSVITTGDLIVLQILHRDTLTTPTGYTLASTCPVFTGSSIDQYTSTCYKFSADGSEAGTSLSVTQASSQRLVVAVQVFRGIASQTPTVLASTSSNTSLSFSYSGSALASNAILVAGVSGIFGLGNDGVWSISNPLLASVSNTSDDTGNNRLIAAHGNLPVGTAPDVTITSGSTTGGVGGVLLAFEADLIPTKSRVSQFPTLALANVDPTARVNQAATMVLWGLDSTTKVSQMPVLLLARVYPRRVFTTTY